MIKGYKGFLPGMKANKGNVSYEVGKTYEMSEPPIAKKQGFHFCLKCSDVFSYIPFDIRNPVAEIEALGEVVKYQKHSDTKRCTNKIKIVRLLSYKEIIEICKSEQDTYRVITEEEYQHVKKQLNQEGNPNA